VSLLSALFDLSISREALLTLCFSFACLSDSTSTSKTFESFTPTLCEPTFLLSFFSTSTPVALSDATSAPSHPFF